MSINVNLRRKSILLIPLTYFIFRLSNVFLVTPFFDEYDSPEYFKWQIFPSFRPHGITSLYAIVGNEFFICVIQAMVGSLVWIYLWFIVLKIINKYYIKVLFTFLFYYLGSSSIIIEQDTSLLSESLSLSASLFLIGISIRIYIDRKNQNLLEYSILGFAIIWFASTKSSNSIITPLIIVIYLMSLKMFSKSNLKYVVALFVSLAGLFFFINALSSDVTKTLTTSGTINNRLIFNEEWKNELIQSGYPILAFQIFENYSKKNLGIPPDQAVVNMPQFKKWWAKGGDSFLLKFTLTNPEYALIAPVALPIFSKNLNFRKSLLSGWSQGTDRTEDYLGFANSVAPRTIMWPDEPEKAYLGLAISFFILGISFSCFTFLNKARDFNLFLLTVVITIGWSYLNWWFGSKPSDMARHNLSAAVIFKVLPIIMLTLSLDYLIKYKNMIFSRFTGVRTSSD
jgi:hypothetical protein